MKIARYSIQQHPVCAEKKCCIHTDIWEHVDILFPSLLKEGKAFRCDSRSPHVSCLSFLVPDVLLLKHVQDPKCFSRTEMDFTCFFETSDNGTYDLFYSLDDKYVTQCPYKIDPSVRKLWIRNITCGMWPVDPTFILCCIFTRLFGKTKQNQWIFTFNFTKISIIVSEF